MNYDVIIVGAGPAGSAAAKILAEHRLNVLLIDRQTFPRPKICGDGLTPGATHLLQQLEVFRFLDPGQTYPIKAIRFVTPHFQTLDIPFKSKHDQAEFLIINRQVLDFALLQSARQSGARFLKAEVTGIIKNGHQIVGVKFKENNHCKESFARLIIGADGASSLMARALQVPKIPAQHRFLAIRGYIKNFKTFDHLVEFIWTAKLKPGYFWIFPTGKNQANIGLGLPADRYKTKNINLKDHFFELLHSPLLKDRILPGMQIKELKSWPIPLAGRFQTRRVFNGALLVGDAGYWVDPLSGEGIHNALKTGMIAAEVGIAALQKNDVSANFLNQYQKKCWDELGPTIRRSLWFVKAMRHLPVLLEMYFWLAGRSQPIFQRFFNHLSHDFEFDWR